jgi:Protein kinase domain
MASQPARRAGSTSAGDENSDMSSVQSLGAGERPPPEDEGAIHAGPLGVIAAPAATPAVNGYSLPEPQKGTHVETSPQGRYLRFEEKLGSGQYKDVYRAYDTSEGIEVAWNTVNIKLLPKEEKKRIMNEVRLLQNLEHKNLVQFHGSWVNREKEQVIQLR